MVTETSLTKPGETEQVAVWLSHIPPDGQTVAAPTVVVYRGNGLRTPVTLCSRHQLARGLAFALGLLLVTADSPRATGTPLDEPFVGGVGFAGPTTGDLTSVYWNPAALSLLTGTELHLSGMVRSTRTTVQRAPLDPTSGRPGPGVSFPEALGNETTWPKPWSPGPGGFLGIGANVLGRFTLAVAAYWPSFEHVRYSPGADGNPPTRYHGIELDLRNFALVPALAVRMGKHLHVGLAPGFLFPAGRFTFDEDTAINQGSPGITASCGGLPCGFENPAAATRYEIDAGQSPFATSPAFTLGAGLHYQRGPLSIGVGYASRALGNDGDGVRLDVQRGRITRGSGATASSPCPPKDTAPCIDGELSYRLPDAYMLGVTWKEHERWSFTGIARYQTFSAHDRLVLTLAGPAGSGFGDAGVRSRIVLDRGFRDRIDLRVRGMRRFGPWGRVGMGVRVATSAVPRDHITPIAVDGLTFEPHAMAELRIGRVLLRAGYALAIVPTQDVSSSAFAPGDAVSCVDSGYDLATSACTAYRGGRARPTAAGRYRLSRHSLSLSLLARF